LKKKKKREKYDDVKGKIKEGSELWRLCCVCYLGDSPEMVMLGSVRKLFFGLCCVCSSSPFPEKQGFFDDNVQLFSYTAVYIIS